MTLRIYFYLPVSTIQWFVSRRVLYGYNVKSVLLPKASNVSSLRGASVGEWVTSPTSTKEGILLVRCFDCCNLIKSWKPTTKSDWLFEEQWKCKVTGETVGRYHFSEKERECKHNEKRPKLALESIG